MTHEFYIIWLQVTDHLQNKDHADNFYINRVTLTMPKTILYT